MSRLQTIIALQSIAVPSTMLVVNDRNGAGMWDVNIEDAPGPPSKGAPSVQDPIGPSLSCVQSTMTPSSRNLARLHVAVLVGLVCIISVEQALGSYDCCISYTKLKLRNTRLIKSIYMQKSSEVCNIDAVIFEIMRKSNRCSKDVITYKICADPEQKWVQDRITEFEKNSVKKKNQKSLCHQNKRKGQKKSRKQNQRGSIN
ncbi:uncharacterized protein WCC33_003031 [Rhinophrynus dorsalis]